MNVLSFSWVCMFVDIWLPFLLMRKTQNTISMNFFTSPVSMSLHQDWKSGKPATFYKSIHYKTYALWFAFL